MWKNLSLRMRLLLPLAAMFAAVVLVGGIALQLFASEQLLEENEPSQRSALGISRALNLALATSMNPEETLEAFVRGLGTSDAIRFKKTASTEKPTPHSDTRTPSAGAPDWFVTLIGMPDVSAAFPILLNGETIGEIVFSPDISAAIREKWVGFLALVLISIVVLTLMGMLAHLATSSAERSLMELKAGLTRMRLGNYQTAIHPSGPPELRHSGEAANELAKTLGELSRDNRRLLHRIVSLQDDERQDVARNLHDELGPLLFGVRANTVALIERLPARSASAQKSAKSVLESVEALQEANRRILDRLRPLYIQELGLEQSVRTILQNAKIQAPPLVITAALDHRLNQVDGPLSQTVYRVIQEAVTNVLKHAHARAMDVRAVVDQTELVIEVSDDGKGFESQIFGRGLIGMHERVRALDGTLEVVRSGGRSQIRCRLPLGDAADKPERQQAGADNASDEC
jgi:two-component system, NarL family, sensor histidine kinase UhpB